MRTFTKFCDTDPVAKQLVTDLPTIQGAPSRYRTQMHELGKHLADGILQKLDLTNNGEIYVICTVEDADFLARGVIEQLENAGLADRTNLVCLWNRNIREQGVSLSPIVREYKDKEEYSLNASAFIVVKSIISGACVVKTNLTRAISLALPEKIFVASPVMLIGAEERLSKEFPAEIRRKFEFVHFATDTEKNGDNVIPGIGGSVYELLGIDKNRYIPNLVKERRERNYPSYA